ncbi:MAG: hypothetical protein IRZ33_07910 [Alicyclobacillaceae bacterium]|nr:hypothetical protein [Alicyclobacillaceae bacterium]
MLRLAKWLVRLYPRGWRQRYADEMMAVLEQHSVTWRTLADLAVGAIVAWFTWERPGLWGFRYLSGICLVSLIALCTYCAIQQPMRWAANEPQLRIARAMAQSLSAGLPVSARAGGPVVDLPSSLDPFMIVYDQDGRVRYANGVLDGKTPHLPDGVLAYTAVHGRDVVTWQPEPGVRIAAVVEHYAGHGGGFVLAGRSLRVTEEDEDALLRGIALAWGVAVGVFTAGLLIWRRRSRIASGLHV